MASEKHKEDPQISNCSGRFPCPSAWFGQCFLGDAVKGECLFEDTDVAAHWQLFDLGAFGRCRSRAAVRLSRWTTDTQAAVTVESLRTSLENNVQVSRLNRRHEALPKDGKSAHDQESFFLYSKGGECDVLSTGLGNLLRRKKVRPQELEKTPVDEKIAVEVEAFRGSTGFGVGWTGGVKIRIQTYLHFYLPIVQRRSHK